MADFTYITQVEVPSGGLGFIIYVLCIHCHDYYGPMEFKMEVVGNKKLCDNTNESYIIDKRRIAAIRSFAFEF